MANGVDVTITRGTTDTINNTSIVDGQILFTTDNTPNDKIYADVGTERVHIGGTNTIDTSTSITSKNPIANKTITNYVNAKSDELSDDMNIKLGLANDYTDHQVSIINNNLTPQVVVSQSAPAEPYIQLLNVECVKSGNIASVHVLIWAKNIKGQFVVGTNTVLAVGLPKPYYYDDNNNYPQFTILGNEGFIGQLYILNNEFDNATLFLRPFKSSGDSQILHNGEVCTLNITYITQ